MDVRQLAFLAGQPSAAVIPRERFMGMPKRGLAFLLANVMFWQPMWAQADGIVVSAPGTGLDRAGNGVPIVNIATPNATGLSHNQFHDYNVTLQGLILNNGSTQTSATQLGGYIVGNPNLKNSGSAQTILNEVNGGSPSQLNGYTEVAGQSARVIVANPYGISCNGCGFINTPRVTLTTGKPVLDNGRLDHFQVDQGSVSIDGAGINASNVDRFEIITRSAKINAQLQANNLTIVAGRNDVNADTLNATARANDGSTKPELAIDSSALGGMYAGAIKLVGTEAGVGVKLDGKLIASGGDIQLDANGQLSLAETSAVNGAVNIKANSLDARAPVYAGTALNVQTQGDLSNQQTLAARDSINLSAGGQLTNNGIIEAGVNADSSRNASGDVNLSAQNFNNSGKSVVASRNLAVNTAQTLNNQGGTLSAKQGANINAGTLDNQNKGRVLSTRSLNLNANQLLNAQGGLVTSNGALLANVGALSNGAAEISSLSGVTLNVGSLDNVAGLVSAGSSLNINASGALNNQRGRLAAQQRVQVMAASLDNSQQGSIISQGTLGLTASGALDNHQAGTIQSTGSAVINSGSLDNHQAGVLTSSNALNLTTGQVDNSEGGRIASAMALTASVSGLDQHNQGQLSGATGLTLDLNNGLLNNQNALITTPGALLLKNLNTVANQSGEISSQQGFTLAATSLDNNGGKVLSEQALVLRIARALDNTGALISASAIDLQADSLNNQLGTMNAGTGLNLLLAGSLNNQGGKLSARDITLQVADLDNRQGHLTSDNSLTLGSQGAINNATGSMTAGQLLKVQGASLDNTQGTLTGSSSLTAKIAGQLLNQAGLLSSNGLLTLGSASLDNQLKGRVVSKADLNLNTAGLLDNRSGNLSAGGALTLNANQVDNRQAGSLSAGQSLNLNIDSLDNQGGNLSSQRDLNLTGTTLDNSHGGRVLANGDINLTLAQFNNQLDGLLSGQAGLRLKAAQLNNGQGGNLYAKGNLDLTLGEQLLNAQGTLKGDGAILLSVGSLNNDGGNLSSVKDLKLTSLGTVSNLGGTLISGDTLDLISGQLNNGAQGSISSTKALTASVSGLDQQNGKLFSSTGLSLDLNNGQLNNQGGLINAPGQLLLKNLKGVANQGGEISSDQGFTLAAQTLDNTHGTVGSHQALILRVDRTLNNLRGLVSANGLDVRAASVDNSAGKIGSDSDLTLNAEGGVTNLNGFVSSAGLSTLKAASLDNTKGNLTGDLGLSIDLSGALNNQGGKLGSGKALSLTVDSLDNRAAGMLLAVDGSLTAKIAGAFDNRELGKLRATGSIDLTTGSLDNRGGSLAGKDRLTVHSDSADNRGGLIEADKDLSLLVGQLDNRDKGALTSKAAINYEGSRLDNSGGLLSAVGPVTLKAQDITNTKGRIASQTDLSATLDTLNQQGGELVAQGSLLLTGKTLDNRNGGLVGSTNALTVKVDQIDNRAGEISSTDNSVNLTGQRLDNSDGGKLLSATDLQLTVAQLINQNTGKLFAKGSARLAGSTLDNSSGSFSGLKGLDIRLDGALLNNAGLLSGEGGFTLNAATLDNTAGKLSSAGALSVTSLGALLNQGGSIITDQGLTLASSSLDNSQKGLINGKGATRVTTGILNNSQGGHLTSDDTLDLTATQVSNGSTGRIASEKNLTASITGLDQQGGELFSKTRLDLNLNNGQLNNQNGLINGPVLVLNNLKDVNNQNGEISSAQAFTVAAQNLDNSAGKLLSNQGLTLRIAQTLNNLNGLISAASLNSRSASLDNSHGLISSGGDVDLGVTGSFTNQSGTLIGDGAVLLAANSLDNSNGSVAGKADVSATITSLNNQNGQLIASGALSLTGSTLDNRQNGLVGATKALKLNVGDIDNRGGELSSSADISLTGNRLDNSDSGQIIAAMGLTMTLGQVLNRNQGLINGKAGLTLDGQTLDNSAGHLLSGQDARLGLSSDLTNNQGQISSEGQLTVNSANLSNTGGSLSSAGALKVNASGALGNQGGQLVSDRSVDLTSASLDNRQQGVISGKGPVGVTTGAFDNSQNGRLNSGDSLSLTAGQVTNQNGGSIGSAKALTASVTGLDQMGGKLFSNTSLVLDLHQGQLNNQNGLINAPSLVLNNLKGVNNQGGEISSAQAFSLAADSLDNSNGKLLSNQAVTLRINQALTNLKGQIGAAALDVRAASLDNTDGTLNSRSDLTLNVAGLLNNQNKGLINAAQNLTLTSADLNNQGGTLLGGSAVTLNAMALNNSANGLINSQGGLSLTANSLNSSNGGEVSAKGDIALTLGALSQNGGRLLSDAGITLDLSGSDLNNQSGLINAKGPLTISRLRDLNNQSGEVSSSQSFTLAGRTFDNSGGKLISNNLLSLNAGNLLNQNGLISGWQGLDVNSASLDNRNNGTLSSRSGNLGVTLSGALLNGGAGALVSQKALTVNAASLDNSGGILSSGAGQSLTVSGLLNNGQNGLIDSGAALTVQAMTLGNAAGVINAQQNLSFTGSTLDNSAGSLVSNGALTLDLLGALTNTNGKLASAGPLVIQRSSQINNQGGQLASQGLMTLLTGGLDNRNRGTVASNNNLVINTSGAVQNSADGLIYSQNGNLQLTAASLANAKGTVQSQGAMTLSVAGDIDNQSGRLLAQNGDLSVSATNLDNRGGTLASVKGALEARIVGVLKNGYDLTNNRQGGIVQAQRLNLSALGGIDNYGGRISAQSGDAIVATRDFDNRNGGLYAKGRVSVTGNNFDNSGDNDGQIAGNGIDLNLTGALNNRLGIIESDSTLSVRAASLDNQTGQLRALGTSGKTDFQIGGLFDNRNGTLETANTDLTLNAASFLNQGGSLLHVGTGTFDISTANVTGAGGSIVTRGGLTLNADSLTNSSVIQAGRLTVNVNNLNQTGSGQLLASTSLVGNGGNWNNDGLIASDGSMSLALGGNYSGNGRISSLGNLGLTAASMTLGSAGSIASGGDATINIGGQLNNYGRMTSATGMTVNAGSINNYGTMGSSGNLRLSTPSLLNENGLIFSGGDTALQVNSFTNHSAQLYSLGAVSIDGYGGAAQAAQVSNISGSLESTGKFSINAANFENRTEGYSLGRTLVSGAIGYNCDKCWGHDYIFSTVVRETYEGQDNDTSAAASLTAGGDFVFHGGNFLNSKSTISAGGNIAIQADNLKNVGAVSGTIERTRIYQATELWRGSTLSFFNEVVAYNQRNNPDFPNVIYVNGSGGLSTATPESYAHREGGHDGGRVEEVRFKDTVTGQEVTGIDFSYQYQQIPQSQYDRNNLMALPSRLQSLALASDVEVVKDGSGLSRSAVIQAGGNVSISATQDLTNSVIHQDYGFSAGANKVQGTQVAGAGAPVVVRINAQLPPNLAQQQVNPLALPGFSLPTGQNGLFRLSGQGGAVQQATQANIGPQSWTMGSASISTAQRQQSLPDIQARSVQIGDIAQVASSDRQLTRITRQVTDSNAGASTINVSAPADTGGTLLLPGHDSSVGAITQVGAVHVDGASHSALATGPDLSVPTLPLNPRDPLATVTSPVAVPLVPPVNTQPGAPTTVSGAVTAPTVSTPLIATPAASQTVARVQGLPDTSFKSNPQKYLIETNPVLTDLKQFMSSDYLLANLGYDPDKSAKRLGDGLYEQKLIQQAVIARTGQRFIDGQTSDAALFKYLMNNAVTSKQQLNLSLGVSLTSEQVAALTHDIVWMENAEVNGEQVLVPVLYLANANNRLAANGALIQGSDVTLIAGNDLNNAGTLRASHNLSAKAGNDLINTGLIEAGNRLDLLAGNNIVNKSGGIIAGRDVSLTAVNGDVINQRDVTGLDSTIGGTRQHRDYLDNAARIEASNDLSIVAGRDIKNTGGVLQSGRDMEMSAGRDVSINSIQERTTDARGSSFLNQQITQHGAEVTAGRDLSISAGRDISAIASRLDAKRDIALQSEGDITLASAADESTYASRSKKTTLETHRVTQQSTEVNAGRDISIDAGKDLAIIASRIKGGADISLDAGQDITIASDKDESSYYYTKKSKGSFGRSSSKQQESYDSTNVASVIDAGHDLTVNTSKDAQGGVSLDGGRDVSIIGSQLKAGNDLILGATNDVAVLSGVEEHGSYSKTTKSGFLGLSKSGKSQLKTTATQVGSELSAGNDAVVVAGNDVRLRASEVTAKNDAELRAGLIKETGDINLVSANDSAYSLTTEYKKKAGLSFKDTVGLFAGTPGFGADITLNAAKKAGNEAISSTSVGSQVSADRDATLNAERDINILGSGVSAGRTVTLGAGRDVNVVAGSSQQQNNSWETNKSYGIKQNIDNNGFTTFVGNETRKERNDRITQTAAASQIDAGQDIKVKAGRDVNQQGSDLQAERNITLQAGRDINIDAAGEKTVDTHSESVKRNGTTTTVAYNLGKTMDTLSGSGKGDDGVSKGSSVLKSVDALGQFFSGPTFDGHWGASSVSQTQTNTSESNRPSSLSAGNDISLVAGNDVNVRGSQFNAGRDINVAGKDITFDVARGADTTDGHNTQSKGGLKGGTTGGFKLGVGISNAGGKDESNQGTSTPAQLNAGRDINLDAKDNLNLIGTQANAERNIDLKAGNDLNIRAAENASNSESSRRSWGAEGGIIAGQDGFGFYGSANIGLGKLEREAVKQQEAYLYAGNRLGFESGRDTTIAGAKLRGDEVIGDVGRNLTVSSVPNTGKADGKEFDANLTVAVSYGVTVTGSVGYGQTNGKTNWVENQTVVSAKDKLDIRTDKHTQLDGAVLSSDSGNLKLDTDTLGTRDIIGKDKEHGYYLSVSGSYGSSGGAQTDKPNKGMEGKDKSSWAVEGYNYNKDREQIVRATVGAGDIVVRDDKVTGKDSTVGLNRDLDKAYEITRDDEHRTELYVSDTSLKAASEPIKTAKEWATGLVNYDKTAFANFELAGQIIGNQLDALEHPGAGAEAIEAGGAEIAAQALSGLLDAGIDREDARALLADKDFQSKVLLQLSSLVGQDPGSIADAKAALEPITGEKNIVVKGKAFTLDQRIVYGAATISEYIQNNPDKAEAVEYVLAAAQGPKGLILLAAQKALGATSAGQAIAEYEHAATEKVGKLIADSLDGKEHDLNKADDAWVVGGGKLMATLLIGASVAGGAKAVSAGRKISFEGNDRVKLDGLNGPKEVGTNGNGVGASINAKAALRAKLSGLEKAQQNAAITKVLPDGRVRYYTQEVPARTEGATRGASFVTENNPQTGQTRQWMESYDKSGNVIRVHPKSINGQPVDAQHYPPTGVELESWK
ncbi:hemagglutinin repeat-containing protein [Pseudomonas sp. H3(2019)]|uniref:hemagglutinin repeat-containing protein n=1 Tax=Pseudomonas sp. H3(2019) TaxID=2598724 RepID=UPI001193B9EC|nr:hemagglutinin repeat-containing protein [Pseudomonas sp. H3(2019)]TVT85721.1 filamentous hemagglutinin N-terminal domain-containing protein [Pseudomonas sp. H3(2019)]